MPVYTGICPYGELYSVFKQHLLDVGWTVDDRTGQDVAYDLGTRAYQVWAADSLYVYGHTYSSYERPVGKVVSKADGGTVFWSTGDITLNRVPISSISRSNVSCSFKAEGGSRGLSVPTQAVPYFFDTSQDTGVYFDDYFFIPTYNPITMYYGGLFCTSPVGLTVGFIKTPYGLLLRPASLVPPYNSASIGDHWPVQYLLKIEHARVIVVLQGIHQFDASALTAIGYTGFIRGDIGDPAGIAVVSTHQHPMQTQRAAVTNTVSDPDLPAYYIVQPATLLTSPNYDTDFMLSSLGLYRNGEGTRGTLDDVYACNIQANTILNGETVTAPDGKKYTFFNIPISQVFSSGGSGFSWYNGFHQNTGAWLAVRH